MNFEKHQKVQHLPKKEDFVKLPKEFKCEFIFKTTLKVKEICDTIYDFAYKEIL
jgi:hypothetical protein